MNAVNDLGSDMRLVKGLLASSRLGAWGFLALRSALCVCVCLCLCCVILCVLSSCG